MVQTTFILFVAAEMFSFGCVSYPIWFVFVVGVVFIIQIEDGAQLDLLVVLGHDRPVVGGCRSFMINPPL